jgi:hypothetical protein
MLERHTQFISQKTGFKRLCVNSFQTM